MWKDLTLEQKAEIMRMSVANGVTDINDIQQLYDGSVGHRFDDAGRIITVGQFPQGFIDEYGDTPISTPSNKSRVTLREAFNDPAWRELHVDVNSVPYLTNYLLRQEQPNSIRPSEGPTSRTKSVAAYDLWKEQNPGTDAILSVLPVTSTLMDGLELYMHPSWENAGWFATSAALDLVGAKLIGKATKGISKADGLSDLTRSRWAAKSKGKPSYYWRGPSKSTKNVLSPEEEKMLVNAAGTTGAFMTDLFTNLTQQQIEWNKKALGGHLYKGGGNKQQLGIIDSILTKHGVNYTKTSGYRGPNSKVGKLGSKSAHARTLSDGSSAAIDIVPGPGSSWDKLYAQMSSPEVRADLAKYGLDILDETSASTMKKTGATGKHFHVGRGIKNQPGKGVFIGSNNPTIAAFNRVYGNQNMTVPDIDYESIYEPAKIYGLDWSNRPQQEEQTIQRPTEPIMSVMEREEPQQEQTPVEQDNFVQLPSFRLSSLQSQPTVAQQRHALVTPIMQAAAQEAPSEVQSILSSPYIIFGRDLG